MNRIFTTVDIMGIDIMGIYIMGVDILRIDILPHTSTNSILLDFIKFMRLERRDQKWLRPEETLMLNFGENFWSFSTSRTGH